MARRIHPVGFALRPRATCCSLLLALTGCLREPSPRAGLFTDVTTQVGVSFEHFSGASGRYYMPEIMGSGCGLFDYDGDEDLDLYAVQGAPLAGSPGLAPPPTNRLFRNDLVGPDRVRGALRFVDVTTVAGVGDTGYGIGCAVGDHDGDGDLDLYVTNFGPNVLYTNQGDGTFADTTTRARVGDPGFGSSAAFFDYDRDGHLDLFVANYVRYSLAENRTCSRVGGQPDYCGPVSYPPAPDRLYHNLGDGTFEDASVSSGIARRFGNGLGVVCADFDGDAWVDVFVANDATANLLWINRQDGTFEERGLAAGAALSGDGLALAGMGVTAGDFDRDGLVDLFITHEASETNTLYANKGKGLFEDATARARLGVPSLPFSGFGTLFLDYDSDGWLDLFVANGAVRRIAEQSMTPWPYVQPDQLFRNQGGHFEEVTNQAGLDAAGVQSGRGAAAGDLDLDGDPDLVVANGGGSLRVLRNDAPRQGISGRIRLRGAKGNRHAVGARVTVKLADGSILLRTVGAEGSYASAMAPGLIHLAWPRQASPVECAVIWPDGSVETAPWPAQQTDLVLTERP